MSKAWTDLAGKVVIVTGGNSGIGSHITQTLQQNGAKVVVADLSVETGEQAENLYNVQTDVTNKESVENMVRLAVEKYGRIDGLVNNAGVNLPRLLVDVRGEKPEYEIDEKAFDFMVSVNQKGPFLCAQAAAKQFVKQDSGVIVNITSEAGMEGSAGQSVYSATKGALNGFTRSWAKELGKYNIRVVGVAPGINEKTGLTTDAYNEALAYTRNVNVEDLEGNYASSIPLGRVGKLDEIADLVTYLVSDHSTYITGTTINISGGKSRG
ncbi:SDR family oxidoreductase [Salinibacillus xinjiangensis]|uniref:Glucose 1-dehydrogenase n=1 Tax=Salinibacillus xinjiangensis TaxID=1229268 RepID=A0A6G1X7A1_9BACI|nr:SDR family oxidoreductase [Salinibacillus xinjiangensis]MRG86785.1 glucose 1-dehydrogenase [Salinibacillus xinjiangensis]